MKYYYSHLLGTVVLSTNGDLLEFISGKSNESQLDQLQKKYPDLKPLPKSKIQEVMILLRDPKYFLVFHDANVLLTKTQIKKSVNEDNLIIQTIANINELDKVSNLLSKRLREWYGLYFPEFSKKMSNSEKFAELIAQKSKEELLRELGMKSEESMGANLKKEDVLEFQALAEEVTQIFALRQKHEQYLEKIMKVYCPNLMELAGATIGAKLLELGKGLKNMALMPSSTIQLLGAEKALFRHIKTGSRSPKYGILFQHPFVQKRKKGEQGKAARILADKLSLCARLDYFKGEFKAAEYAQELEKVFQ